MGSWFGCQGEDMSAEELESLGGSSEEVLGVEGGSGGIRLIGEDDSAFIGGAGRDGDVEDGSGSE